MKITDDFDAGNIQVIDASDPNHVQLAIREDTHSHFYQWFYFRITDCLGVPLTLHIMNAGGAAYAEGWDGYQAVASGDDTHWQRQITHYHDGVLTIEITPTSDQVDIAYFAPYSLERHARLIEKSLKDNRVNLLQPGNTLQGRPLEILKVGNPDAAKTIWITARQHPGESMAAWLMEGLIKRLLNANDSMSHLLLEHCCFYLVPTMNPDGSHLGNLRTNAAGANLNREWLAPSVEQSPEVFYIQELMLQTGCDLYLDIHGDETIPYNFIAGQEGLTENLEVLRMEEQFKEWLLEASEDFQIGEGYAPAEFGEESFKLASNWVGRQFSIPAMTLEMPFKDHNHHKESLFGWSPQRSQQLGHDLLTAIAQWKNHA